MFIHHILIKIDKIVNVTETSFAAPPPILFLWYKFLFDFLHAHKTNPPRTLQEDKTFSVSGLFSLKKKSRSEINT